MPTLKIRCTKDCTRPQWLANKIRFGRSRSEKEASTFTTKPHNDPSNQPKPKPCSSLSNSSMKIIIITRCWQIITCDRCITLLELLEWGVVQKIRKEGNKGRQNLLHAKIDLPCTAKIIAREKLQKLWTMVRNFTSKAWKEKKRGIRSWDRLGLSFSIEN